MKMKWDPRHKSVVITGAGSGIGRATAILLSQQFSCMHLVGRFLNKLEETAKLASCSAELHAVDLANPNQRGPLMERLQAVEKPITTLVHCAGDGMAQEIDELTIAELRQLQELHVYTLLELIKVTLPAMRQLHYGRIVGVSSLAPLRPQAFMVAYASTKSAMKTAMQCIAAEVVKDGITVNTVSPGNVDTPLGNRGRAALAQLYGLQFEKFQAERTRHLPSAELIAPDEVAQVIRFLVDPATKSLSGQDIVISGTAVMR
jgi:3-oxoacyl-[acyl-carrier protein] reductase